MSAVLLLTASAPTSVAAAACPVQIRLWVEDGDAWFDHGETVTVPITERRPRLGVYLDAGRNREPAKAEWGYAKDFGFDSARPAEVAAHLRFVQQNAQDVDSGRLRFTLEAVGATFLGYRIVGAADPAGFEALDEGCLTGEVRIEIVDPAASDEALAESDERATALCQEAVREKMTNLSGARIEFGEATSESLSETEVQVTLGGELIVNERRQAVGYSCVVDLAAGEVSEIRFERP
jgi:hypothetical protein